MDFDLFNNFCMSRGPRRRITLELTRRVLRLWRSIVIINIFIIHLGGLGKLSVDMFNNSFCLELVPPFNGELSGENMRFPVDFVGPFENPWSLVFGNKN
ncbi:unnamed protein product [Prunus armeniaca]